MKMGQLFRELLHEEGFTVNEEHAREADMLVPETQTMDVPDEFVSRLKEVLRPEVKKHMSKSLDECRKDVMNRQQLN